MLNSKTKKDLARNYSLKQTKTSPMGPLCLSQYVCALTCQGRQLINYSRYDMTCDIILIFEYCLSPIQTRQGSHIGKIPPPRYFNPFVTLHFTT